MFDFINMDKNEIVDSSIDKSRDEKNVTKIATGYAATGTAQVMTQKAASTYAKPSTYTGNRNLFDSGVAKANAKKELFSSEKTVLDPYTGDKLVLTKSEAKALYGENWTSHLAESDHIKPLEKVFNDSKNNVWNTTEDIKNAANSPDNMQVMSRKVNNAKRSKTNEELLRDEKYLQSKGIKVSEKNKEAGIKKGEAASKSIDKQLNKSAVKNVVKTGHEAGMAGAKSAGVTTLTVSGIMNMVSVIKGEKKAEDAVIDTIKDGGKAAVTGYAMTGGLTVASHSLSNSTSKLVQGLTKSNVPGKVITAVIVTGDTFKKWGNGEITTQECLIELGDKGLNMATMGYSMAIGQALIPIPIVGGAVGALVGSLLTSAYYKDLINTLKMNEIEHQERLRIIEECNKAAEQTKKYREELESYLESYFLEYRECFDNALNDMHFAFQIGDAEGVIAASNSITEKLGGIVNYRNVEEFKGFLDSNTVDEF